MKLSAFIHQKSYEHIECQLRKHPVVLVPPLLLFLLLLAVPFVAQAIVVSVWPALLTSQTFLPLLILLGSIYFLSIGLFFFTYFVTFYLDLLIITNDRLLHIEQHGLFSRTVAELDLCNIQDATSEVHGFFSSLFRFGTLHIQTAGAGNQFIIKHIPNPEKLRQTILDLADKDRLYQNIEKTAK